MHGLERLDQLARLEALDDFRKLRLRVVRDPALPRHCRADGPKLRQLFLLLLGNAIKFARPGELGLHLACEPDPHDPQRALLRCRLTLPGLARPDLEAFVRSTGGPRDAAAGPSLAQELTGALGGELEVGAGELRIDLPVGLVPAGDEPTIPRDPRVPSEAGGASLDTPSTPVPTSKNGVMLQSPSCATMCPRTVHASARPSPSSRRAASRPNRVP